MMTATLISFTNNSIVDRINYDIKYITTTLYDSSIQSAGNLDITSLAESSN